MPNKICVYAICKNESQFVEKWYNSMKEADYVVVLDTGSTDDTVEKLKSLGAIVEQKIISPWRFDVARNEAMKLVPEDCNIFVSTDLDEYFEPGWAQPLRDAWIEGQHQRCLYTYYLSDRFGKPSQKILYNKIHGKGWYWKYPVHELLLRKSDDSELMTPEQELNLSNSVVLYHYPDITKSRSNYIDLLELRTKEDPKDFYGLYYLAVEYEKTDVRKAIEVAKRGIEISDNDFYRFIFMTYIGLQLEDLNDNEGALVYFVNAINLCSEFRFVFLHIAKILFNTYKNYDGAYKILMDGLKRSWHHDYWFERSEGWGSDYYDLISLSAYYSDRKAESLIFALVASDKDKDDNRLRKNIDTILNQITDKEIYDYEE